MRRRIAVLVLILAGLAAVTAWRAAVFAQARTPAQDQDVLPALLIEVRGLRAAMEQMASAGPRVQLALGRLQLQEQRVNNILRRLETVRTSLAESQRGYENSQQQLAQVEDTARDPQSGQPNAAQLKEMQAQLKVQITLGAADVQRLTAEESALSAELAAEQGRWTDLNQRMEELERSLTRR